MGWVAPEDEVVLLLELQQSESLDIFVVFIARLCEELQEIEESSDMQNKEEEVGDLLFSVVNAIRWMGFDAEATLRHANRRFYNRFTTMEELSRLRGFSFKHLSESDKNALWDEAKVLNQTN